MEYFLLTILFISVLSNYILALYVFTGERPRRRYPAVVLLCVCMAIIILKVQEDSLKRLLVQVFAVFAFLLVYRSKSAGKVGLIFFVLSALSSINGYVLVLFLYRIAKLQYGEVLLSIFEQLMMLILLIAVIFVKRKIFVMWTEINKRNFKYIYFTALFVSAIVLAVSLGSLNVLQQYSYKHIHRIVLSIIGIFSYFAIIVIVLLIISFKRLNQRLEELLAGEKELRIMQMRYYDSMRDKVEETAKYRHDLTNHLIVLRQLVGRKDIEKIDQYLEEMEIGLGNIQNMTVSTGNAFLDVLCTYFFSRWKEQLTIQTIGRVSGSLNISEYDMCTIFANLFQNIDDEVRRNPSKCTWVRFEIYQGFEFIQFVIKNNRKACELRNRKTSKGDSENHGYGLTNVKETVSKNHGFFEVYESPEEYVVKVSLPIK